ncbi:GNAT family N-acetyltransferase [Nocardiopsis sp. RSe5-2]|uniref:GNAT family N-acetyltransferase n=1 Tax=Nocardiopsis endophytica TaxID=3018445 RepID=A0ABT4UD92_9ACTN|nr:GNAT family N-acetyltransferase [Nocardiopsis endophytica]MDA2814931.1 GNAT family N-acetyltransferase [Nocardiopsis endophytica]
MLTNWDITPADVHGPEAAAVLREYYRDIVGRYYGREATEAEIDAAMAEDPSGSLVPPDGLFLVARAPDRPSAGPLGCVGLHWFGGGKVAEIKRLFVAPAARGLGGGVRLLEAIEKAAKEGGATLARLDTRSDLVEARRLYAANGYEEVAPFNEGPYAEHWFAKQL